MKTFNLNGQDCQWWNEKQKQSTKTCHICLEQYTKASEHECTEEKIKEYFASDRVLEVDKPILLATPKVITEDELIELDKTLSHFEDFIHGEDAKMLSSARKIIHKYLYK